MGKRSSYRCSPAVRSLGHLPIGTAPTRTSFLLLDVELPWSRDLGDDPALAPVGDAIERAAGRGERWRLQGMVPGPDASERQVAAHHLPDGRFSGYRRHAVAVRPDEVVEAAIALIDEPAAVAAPSTGGEAELLLCTHGRRDACCGSSGTALWKDLVARPGLLPPATRLCRTSHTGGHRFAPTAIHLPTGSTWAWLDVDAVSAILRQDVPFAALADRYRGSCALATPAEQVVEHAVMVEVGWAWLSYGRSGSVVDDGTRQRVTLAYSTPEGTSGEWSAEVETIGRAPVPDCGGPLDTAPKHQDLLAVVPGTLAHSAA